MQDLRLEISIGLQSNAKPFEAHHHHLYFQIINVHVDGLDDEGAGDDDDNDDVGYHVNIDIHDPQQAPPYPILTML